MPLVLVLQPHGGESHAAMLLQQGFQAQGCASLSDLSRCYDDARPPLLLLAGALDDAYMASTRMRALDAGMGIVVVGRFASSDQRVRAMQCGADVCLPAGVDATELVASLQALARRAPAGRVAIDATAGTSALQSSQAGVGTAVRSERLGWTADMEPIGPLPDAAPLPPAAGQLPWHLQDGGWTLAGPRGNRLRLTTSERAFMSRLLAAPGRRLSRGDLLASLGKVARPGPGTPDGELGGVSASLRGVDVMVCRLRRKAQQQGIALPLRAVYRWGYMFVEEP